MENILRGGLLIPQDAGGEQRFDIPAEVRIGELVAQVSLELGARDRHSVIKAR